jgi:hypothetical protein
LRGFLEAGVRQNSSIPFDNTRLEPGEGSRAREISGFNRLPEPRKTAEAVEDSARRHHTRLKPGVNERPNVFLPSIYELLIIIRRLPEKLKSVEEFCLTPFGSKPLGNELQFSRMEGERRGDRSFQKSYRLWHEFAPLAPGKVAKAPRDGRWLSG